MMQVVRLSFSELTKRALNSTTIFSMLLVDTLGFHGLNVAFCGLVYLRLLDGDSTRAEEDTRTIRERN